MQFFYSRFYEIEVHLSIQRARRVRREAVILDYGGEWRSPIKTPRRGHPTSQTAKLILQGASVTLGQRRTLNSGWQLYSPCTQPEDASHISAHVPVTIKCITGLRGLRPFGARSGGQLLGVYLYCTQGCGLVSMEGLRSAL